MDRDTYSKRLSENLRSIRRSKRLTTADLAKILGVSQAKISYIEHNKGVLSARDVAVLSRRLDVPITEFFRGLTDPEDSSEVNTIIPHLVRFGATLLAKPSGVILKPISFEEIFWRSLSFTDDNRLFKALCAALITQTSRTEISSDLIFAHIGGNKFLISQAGRVAEICLGILGLLKNPEKGTLLRAARQIEKISSIACELLEKPPKNMDKAISDDELQDFSTFVEDCMNAKR